MRAICCMSSIRRSEFHFNGILFPSSTNSDWIPEIPDYPVSPGDLYVVAYPKSGMIWTLQVVSLIKTGGAPREKHNLEAIPWIEAIGKEFAHALSPPHTFMCHLPYHMMPGRDPADSAAKYIYVTRNPKDVAVSFYHHMKHTHHLTFTSDWDTYFESFLKGDVFYGLWFDHILEWWKRKDADNILFMKYEDMKMDLPGSVKRISKSMGYSLEESVINTIAKQCTIESMRADPLGNPDEYLTFVDKNTSFLRKGIVGDWKNHFSDEQSLRFDAEYAKRMAGSGLDFI